MTTMRTCVYFLSFPGAFERVQTLENWSRAGWIFPESFHTIGSSLSCYEIDTGVLTTSLLSQKSKQNGYSNQTTQKHSGRDRKEVLREVYVAH